MKNLNFITIKRWLVSAGFLAAWALVACGGGGGGAPGPLGGAANQASGGGSLDTQLPAPAFDPQGESKYFFTEDAWRPLVTATRRFAPGLSNFEISGTIFEHEHSTTDKDRGNPCCDGRWILLREGNDAVCRLFQIEEGGKLTFSAGFLPENGFPLAIAKPGYEPPTEKEFRPCPPIYDGVSVGEFSFFPVGYTSFRSNPNPNEPAAFIDTGIQYPANSNNSGIRSISKDATPQFNFNSQSLSVIPHRLSINRVNVPQVFNSGTSDNDQDSDPDPVFEVK